MTVQVDTIKKIVAFSRAKSSYFAMRKRGDITADECAVMVANVDAQIAALRSQGDLPLGEAPAAPPAASKAPSKGA